MKRIFVTLFFLILAINFPKSVWAYSKVDILTSINSTRKEYLQKELKENELLKEAAENKLADIQKYSYWAHNNPITGKTWLSFVKNTGFRGISGENLAKGFSNTEKMIKAWIVSPSHKKNLLSSGYNSVGIAMGEVKYGEKTETVVVTVFGKNYLFATAIKNFSNSLAYSP